MQSNRLALVAPLSVLICAAAALGVACSNSDDDDNNNQADAAPYIDGGIQEGVPSGSTGTLGNGDDDGGSGDDAATGSDATTGDAAPGQDAAPGTDAGGDSGGGPTLPTSLLVLRVGNTTTAAAANVNPTYIDQVTLAGGAITNWVDFTGKTFGIAGTGSEGGLTLSADGHSVTLGGYAAADGTTTASGPTRAIGLVSAAQAVTITSISGPFANATNGAVGAVRDVVTKDGAEFWATGSGSSATNGVWYFTAATPAGAQVQTTPATTRAINILGGNLFATAAPTTTTGGVYQVGTGLPTSGALTDMAPLTTSTLSPYGFVGFDTNGDGTTDRVYVADSNAGIVPFSLSGTTWTAGTAVPLPAASAGAFAVTGALVNGAISLWATNYTSKDTDATAIYSLTDSVATPALTAAATAVVSAPTGEIFRGISLLPQ